MSFKSKMLAGAATLALVGGVATVGSLSASAATPSCGHRCINVFSRQFGTHHSPNFVMDVFRQGAKVGQPIILFRSSNADPAQDFTVSFQGLVSDFFAAGLTSAAMNINRVSASDLVLFLGLKQEEADRIVSNRPYRVKGELVAKNVVPKEKFDLIKDRISVSQ